MDIEQNLSATNHNLVEAGEEYHVELSKELVLFSGETSQEPDMIEQIEDEFEGFTILGETVSPFEIVRSRMKERIIGQPQAIDAIVSALDASKIRTKNDRGPIAVLAFLGPTGVGKTETARALADVLADMLGEKKGNLVKIDASDFQHGHEVTKLFGSPPSYVGDKIKPMFAPDNIQKPATVVLIDELEKGAPELQRQLLHIMDDGIAHLNNGKTTDFSNTIIIMTGNVGAEEMNKELSRKKLGFGNPGGAPSTKSLDAIALGSFDRAFPPEFINRFSEKVVFHPFDREKIGTLLDSKIAALNDEYIDTYGVCVTLSNTAREHIIDETMKRPELAGREMMRVLKKYIQTDLGRYIGGNHISEGTQVQVFHRDEPAIQRFLTNTDDREYIFAQRHDDSIRKKRKALPPSKASTPRTKKLGNVIIKFSDRPDEV